MKKNILAENMRRFNTKNLVEQEDPIDQPTGKPGPDAKRTPAEITAWEIYTSYKGGFFIQNNDPNRAIKAIKSNIKNIHGYNSVNKEFQNIIKRYPLAGHQYTGIGEFLKTFMDTTKRLEVINYLKTILPRNQWGWTILKIMPKSDFKTLNTTKLDPELLDFYKSIH